MSDTLLDKNKIWQQIDDEKENMLQLWQELVNVDCGSGNKAGVDFIAQKIEAVLKSLGFTTTQIEFEKAGNTLVGKIGFYRFIRSHGHRIQGRHRSRASV